VSRVGLFLPMVAMACGGGGPDEVEDLLDTGWFTDTAIFDAENCKHKVHSTFPEPGADDWYWKSPMRIYTATTRDDAYVTWLVDDTGMQIDLERSWSEAGLDFELSVPGGLSSNTDYVLHVNDCGAHQEIPFSTSDFGQPLSAGPEALNGKTYHLDLVDAEWVEPGGIGGLLALYFTTPILVGVKFANDTSIDFIGGPGELDPFGGLQQDLSQTTWDFPLTDFRDAPFFEARSDGVTFTFQGLEVEITDFRLAGTFSADMSTLGGLEMSGLGDSRNLGGLLNNEDEAAVCELAQTFGVDCVACPDGEPLCLFMSARDVTGTWLPDVTMVDRN
jgi:hypothetical protein